MTRDQEKKRATSAVKAIIKLTDKKARIDQVLPRVIDAHKCPTLYLEWTVEKFWGLQSPKLIVELNKCYDELVKEGYTEKNKFDFNDADDRAWYEPCGTKGRRAMCHTSQNFNFVFVWEEPRYPDDRPDLHIRRFYDVYNKKQHSWGDEGKLTTQKAIDKAEHYNNSFADVSSDYPRRLTLKAYRDKDFQMLYGDGRDAGYIGSYCGWKGEVHWAMSTHTELKLIHECFIPSLCCSLFEDKDKQVCNTTGCGDAGYDSTPKVEYCF